METKQTRAVELRDVALLIVTKRGTWQPIYSGSSASGMQVISHHALTFKDNDLTISYRTPFQKLPPVSDQMKALAARMKTPIENLPYGLDIWCPTKVLNVEWDDKGSLCVVSFQRGAWEQRLEAISTN